MNTPLSPAAQAVITAQAKQRCLFEWGNVSDPPCHPSDANWNGCVQCIDRLGTAADLRAAADQVVPEGGVFLSTASAARIRSELLAIALLAIATELENHQ